MVRENSELLRQLDVSELGKINIEVSRVRLTSIDCGLSGSLHSERRNYKIIKKMK